MSHLFVYGTLLPGEGRWKFLAPFVTDEGEPDTASGALFDTGLGDPAARFGEPHESVGRTFTLVGETVDDALARLDEIEGAVAGLYRRTEVVTGRGVTAWAYEYGDGLALERIASGSWLHR